MNEPSELEIEACRVATENGMVGIDPNDDEALTAIRTAIERGWFRFAFRRDREGRWLYEITPQGRSSYAFYSRL